MLIFKKEQPSFLFTTGKDTWETPPVLFQKWDAKYHFVLDAAANAANHKVKRWFGPEGESDNALTVKWPLDEGNIWLNPPYSLQQRFVRKAWIESWQQPYSVVCLLPVRTDTRLFHDMIQPHAKLIHFLRGRLKFKDKQGQTPNTAPFPSMVVVF